jgi:diguanylate cyclase (GGDEF)-like protein
MDSKPFIDSYREINQGFVKFLDILTALSSLSGIEERERDEYALIKASLKVLTENQDLARCSVFLLEGEALHCATGYDWDDLLEDAARAQRPSMSFRLGEGIIGQAAQSGELQHCRDCANDPRFQRQSGDGRAPGAVVCVPIRSGETIIGVLNVSHSRAGFFSEAHERSLLLFCEFLAHILANARHTRALEAQVRQRTEQLEQALGEARALKERYHQLALVDELTGLHNRRFFFPEAAAALARTLRNGQPFTVLVLDLGDFKGINDRHGHAIGDQVLVRIGQILRQQTRDGDILARLGGDEFVLALPDTASEGGRILAGRIGQAIADQKMELGNIVCAVFASIGLSSLVVAERQPVRALLERLLAEADQAMYAAKKAGRNQLRIFGELAP